MRRVPPDEAARALRDGAAFVDVRTPGQHRRDGLPDSLCLPLAAIQAGAEPAAVAKDQPVYLVCDRGHLSELAGLYLEQAGFSDVVNVLGGLLALRACL